MTSAVAFFFFIHEILHSSDQQNILKISHSTDQQNILKINQVTSIDKAEMKKLMNEIYHHVVVMSILKSDKTSEDQMSDKNKKIVEK